MSIKRDIAAAELAGVLYVPDAEELKTIEWVKQRLLDKGQQDPARIERAYEIAVKGLFVYKATQYNTTFFECTCPDFRSPRYVCKHVMAGWMMLGQLVEFDE